MNIAELMIKVYCAELKGTMLRYMLDVRSWRYYNADIGEKGGGTEFGDVVYKSSVRPGFREALSLGVTASNKENMFAAVKIMPV